MVPKQWSIFARRLLHAFPVAFIGSSLTNNYRRRLTATHRRPPSFGLASLGHFFQDLAIFVQQNLVPAELHVGSIFVYNFGPFGLMFDVFFLLFD